MAVKAFTAGAGSKSAAALIIRSVSIQLITLPLDLRIGGSVGVLPALEYVLVQLASDQGHLGVGHGFGLFPGEGQGIARCVERLASLVVGQDPLRPEHLWKRMHAGAEALEPGPSAAAMSAIDVALWDLQGMILEQPVYKLLGGSRESIPTYASHDLWEGLSPVELARNAAALVKQGFRALKIRTGGSADPVAEAERLEAVRSAVGPDVDVMYDALQYYQADEAIAIGRALEPHGLYWLEDPVQETDLDGLSRVTSELDAAVASGESLLLPEAFVEPIERRAQDIAMVDLKWVGGITAWRRVAAHAASVGLPVVSHLQTQVSAHVLAGIPNGLFLEYMPWGFELFDDAPLLADGAYVLGEEPGLGLRLRAEFSRWRRVA